MTAAAMIAPRRVLLTADELDLLRRLAGDLRLPIDFRMEPPRPTPPGGWSFAGMVGSLRERGLLQSGPAGSSDSEGMTIHASVRANLAVLAAAEALVETRLQAGVEGATTQGVRAAHAVAGELGGSLVRLGEAAAVELSIFPAAGLGAELSRIVPRVGGRDPSARWPTGIVPLAALTQLEPAERAGPHMVEQVVADLRLGAGELSRARALLARACGVLQATVLVRPRMAGAPVAFGRVLWLATADGWLGLAPEPGPRGDVSVRLQPVEPEHLGAWLAPLVGQAIL